MNTKQIISAFALVIISSFQQTKVNAQVLISDTLINSISQMELIEMMSLPIVQFGVNAYKIQYLTNDLNGNESIASGLIVVPNSSDCSWSLTSYLHGTVSHKEHVPSRLSNEALVGYYASAIIGSVVALPDYLGLGDSPGFHPYVHAETEASASLDMLRATREFCENHNIYLNDDIFLFGYSQGGHSTLALQKLIEQENAEEFNITSSIPMAGPYDLSGVQTDLLTDGDDYPAPYYLPYLVLSYYNIYPEINEYEYDSLFISPYDSLLPLYFDGYHSAGEIDAIMPSDPVNVLNPNFYNAFLSDSLHPFRQALEANDLTNWTPVAPINFYYCGGDEHVTYLNAIVAAETINNLEGVTVELTEIDPNFDHSQCAEPSITQAILSFLQQAQSCNTSVAETHSAYIHVLPNPANNFVTISVQNTSYELIDLLLIDGIGRVVLTKELSDQNKNKLNVSSLNAGLYFLQLSSEGKLIGTEKFIKN